MSTIAKRLSVEQYDKMVEHGILPETNRFELIEGRIVEKDAKDPAHPTAVMRTMRDIERVLPPGWHVRKEDPVRIPNRRSEPEPDVSIVRGSIDDYANRHPNPDEVALVVEVTRATVAKDRALVRVYLPGGISAYWILNLPRRRLEVYTPDADKPTVLTEADSVDLIIAGDRIGRIAVTDLLPPANE